MLTGLRLEPEDFSRIAAGGPSGAAAGLLRAGQHSRRVLRVLDAIGSASPSGSFDLDDALDLLDRAQAPAGVWGALGHPSIGPWALACANGAAPLAHLASIAAAAGIAAGLEFSLTVPVLPRGVVFPGIGVLRADGERTALVEGGPGEWAVSVGRERHLIEPHGPGEPWIVPASLAVSGGGSGSSGAWRSPRWTLFAEFADPYLALPPGAPDLHLGPLPRSFRLSLAQAWGLLVARHRDRAEDVAATLRLLVPLRSTAGTFANASRPDAFGAVWLDVAAKPHRLASALVHELEHARLSALHDLAPLHVADPEPRHRVPWRRGPRSVHALLHGLYAHAAVVEFWQVEAAAGDESARGEQARYAARARHALDAFTDRGALTPAGAELVAALELRIAAGAADSTARQVTVSPGARTPSRRPVQPGPEEVTVEVEQAPAAAPARLEPSADGPLAIVHASMDRMWAEWLGEQYEQGGVPVKLVRYEADPDHTLAEQLASGLRSYPRLTVVFSAPFMVAVSGTDEQWAEAIVQARPLADRVVPVLVGRCKLPSGFWLLEPVNLFGVEDGPTARHRLLRRADANGGGPGGGQAAQVEEPADLAAENGFLRYPGRAPDLTNEQLPGRNAQFTGRRDHLDLIREGLTGNRVTLVPHTLYGLGGVGKTEIAKEYAHRFGPDYDLVWWVRSESRAVARASLAKLGEALGADPTASRGECIRYAHEALRRGQPYQRWLLVFDNADDVRETLDLLPKSSGSGHVLITSRNPDWSAQGTSVPVDVYPRRESVEFLRRRVPEISTEDADGFADAVQDLPLALEHAASWYRETGRSAEDYRELMDTRFRSLFRDKQFYPILTLGTQSEADGRQSAEPDSEYVKTVASAYLMASQTMADDQRNPAMKLLELLSFFAPAPVPLDLVRAVPDGLLPRDLQLQLKDEQATLDMIRAISTRSLAKSHTPADGQDRRHTLEMHRVVQLFTANSMAPDRVDATRMAARMALVNAASGYPEDPRNYRAYLEVIPHLTPTWALRSHEPGVHKLVLDACRSLLRQGEYKSCETLVRRALPEWEQELEPTDEDLLTLRRCLGLARSGLGDQLDRLRINTEVLELATRSSGADSDIALRARGSIASALLWLGRVQEAEQEARTVLETVRGKYGDEDARTLREMFNYAAHLRLAGRHKEALELDRTVHERYLALRREGVSETRETLIARTNLARDLRELGYAYDAAQEQEDNYAACVAVLGQGDPETMHAMIELAVIRRRAGRYEEAYEMGGLVLERHAAQLGENHPDYIKVLTNFAGDCRFIGQTARGRELAREAYEKAQEIIPSPNPIRAATATNLAVFLRGDGDLEEATRLDTAALAELRQILGDRNHYTLACQINLANDKALSGNLEEAKQLHEDAWTKLSQLRGAEHPHALLARANLELTLAALGEADPRGLEGLLTRVQEESKSGVGMTAWERRSVSRRDWLNCDLTLPMY